ncbi:metallophosphoesterase [Dokdonia sp. Hel_I_53]|uniref:metallophosphoesterase n=1 Tax=Dokdonia sp. Hel_I_53 TaxID=1566287 RepID=UPI00119B7965|nr:metallophosphoesterase [Dokdonia sp. Hel_I_53]TVZ50986.1 calcineurin-like phosphoesterase family protein [Dokdonia sp. Hel_I_53]
MNKNYLFLNVLLCLLLSGCATYNAKYLDEKFQPENFDNSSLSRKRINTSFYLIGDAGGDKDGGSTYALDAFKKVIDTSKTENDYAIFLGDNIYEAGLPKKKSPERKEAERRLNIQIASVENFEGKKLFIPGNHDWYAGGVEGVKRQEKYIKDAFDDNEAFQPENGCPIEMKGVNDEIELMIIDTQWYLENWDNHPTINDECTIRTREALFLEIENEFKKNNEKTIVVVMHHPMYTNGIHGGKYSIDKHLYPSQSKFPLPILASLVTQIRSQGGVSIQDRYNKQYNELMQRISVLASDTDKVIFASGHEHSLQYIEHDAIKQIVSGAGAKQSAAALGDDGLFSYGGQGFAILDIFEDESSAVRFYSAVDGNPKLLFTKEVFPPRKKVNLDSLPKFYPQTVKASIYQQNDTDVSEVHKSLWGDHYREVYGTPVTAQVATLDTLMGGFTVDRKGGGHQTRSLRLRDKDGRAYNLRALRKSAVQFLQSVAFKDKFVQEEFKNTFTEDLILDFYTSAHPYASLAVAELSNAVGIYHTNPKLVYIPKHKALGKYNDEYGDELYFIEERPDEDFLMVDSFGNPDSIDSTEDLFENLRDDEEYQVDENAFLRARIFDMLIGDWDRHTDQWRWARFDENGKKIYKPIPRDRDQVFSKFDGAILGTLKTLIPAVQQFQNYDGDVENVKWINEAGIKMDRTLLRNATKQDWIREAQFIQDNLSDEEIDIAFSKLPLEVQDLGVSTIKESLRERRSNIVDIAKDYYNYISSLIIITGTDKDDHFEITRGNGETRVQISRIKDDKVQEPFVDRLIRSDETREIWIYGLDDDDVFHVSGEGKRPIKMKIIGGQNNDIYDIEDGRRLKVFEHKTKPNTVKQRGGAHIKFSNIYNFNTYDPLKKKSVSNSILPAIGFNPDDGFLVGISDVFTTFGFKNDPFSSKHTFNATYSFATKAINLNYEGDFANAFGQWNLVVGGKFTNESFSRNFFGFGNETENFDDDLGLDYNRVRNGELGAHLGVESDNTFGSKLRIIANFERIEIEQTEGRVLADPEIFTPDLNNFYGGQSFVGVEGAYTYVSADNDANPTRGFEFAAIVGGKRNLSSGDRMYAYLNPKMGFYNALSRNRKLVLKTLIQSQLRLGDDFEFYQAASLGARTGLRGYRFNRFTGEAALAGSADLRYSFDQFSAGLLPVQIGVFGGGDLGRVWVDNQESDKWHNDFGGGFWVNMIDTVSGQVGAFVGEDGMRIDFRFGVRL